MSAEQRNWKGFGGSSPCSNIELQGFSVWASGFIVPYSRVIQNSSTVYVVGIVAKVYTAIKPNRTFAGGQYVLLPGYS